MGIRKWKKPQEELQRRDSSPRTCNGSRIQNSIQIILTKEDPVYEEHLKHDYKDEVHRNRAQKIYLHLFQVSSGDFYVFVWIVSVCFCNTRVGHKRLKSTTTLCSN